MCSMSSLVPAKFEVGDTVRVVTSDTPFFGWRGEVRSVEELELGCRHYLVRLLDFPIAILQPFLFREIQLAHAYIEKKA
jgi:hypothetical protein